MKHTLFKMFLASVVAVFFTACNSGDTKFPPDENATEVQQGGLLTETGVTVTSLLPVANGVVEDAIDLPANAAEGYALPISKDLVAKFNEIAGDSAVKVITLVDDLIAPGAEMGQATGFLLVVQDQILNFLSIEEGIVTEILDIGGDALVNTVFPTLKETVIGQLIAVEDTVGGLLVENILPTLDRTLKFEELGLLTDHINALIPLEGLPLDQIPVLNGVNVAGAEGLLGIFDGAILGLNVVKNGTIVDILGVSDGLLGNLQTLINFGTLDGLLASLFSILNVNL